MESGSVVNTFPSFQENIKTSVIGKKAGGIRKNSIENRKMFGKKTRKVKIYPMRNQIELKGYF